MKVVTFYEWKSVVGKETGVGREETEDGSFLFCLVYSLFFKLKTSIDFIG